MPIDVTVDRHFIIPNTVSIAYTLMKRCGIDTKSDTKSYFKHEDFSPITSAAVSLLGTAVSEQSE